MSHRRHDSLPDPALAHHLREAFKQHSDALDPWVATRLAAIRRDALRASHSQQGAWRRWSLPAGLAFALLLSLAIWQPWQTTAPPPPTQVAADMEIMLSDDNLELYADLDFYAWLGNDDAQLQ